jgi:hypothetical protein
MKRITKSPRKKKSLSLVEVVNQLIARGMKALETGKLKVTVSDLIRVSERQKELAPKPPPEGA